MKGNTHSKGGVGLRIKYYEGIEGVQPMAEDH